jgi:release factor glutamine methyltransferase
VSKPRVYRKKGIRLAIAPGVFHPAFFFSTSFLLKFTNSLPLAHKTFFDLGAGNGLVAFNAAKKGARVTVSDISTTVIEYLHKNSEANKLPVRIITSDLFTDIPNERFDFIIISPPYYKKDPINDAERAWYCGANSQYFHNLFETMADYVYENTSVFMILSDECDIQLIQHIAAQNNFRFLLVRKKRIFWEMNFIFKIEKNAWHDV